MPGVVLVGTGASMLGSGLGRAIDGHDIVVRSNNFCINGFENDVGTKRTEHWRSYHIRFINPHCVPPENNNGWLHLNDNRYEQFELAVLWPIAKAPISHFPELSAYKKWVEAPPSVVMNARIGSFPMKNNPSSGLMAVMYAMLRFDSISICGFDCLLNPAMEQYSYYYSSHDYGKKVHVRHNFECEHRCIEPFIKQGRVKVLK